LAFIKNESKRKNKAIKRPLGPLVPDIELPSRSFAHAAKFYRRGGVIPPFGVFPPNKIIQPISNEGARTAPLQHGKTLGQMIAWFKYESTKEISRNVSGNPSVKIWQRNYFERIVRNDEELDRIRDYITTNPETWEEDENNV